MVQMVWYSKLWIKICLLVVIVGSAVGVYIYIVLLQSKVSPMTSVSSEPLFWSMELGKSEYQYGENMTITFRVENIGNETVTILRKNPGWWHPNYTKTSYHKVHAPYYKLEQFHFGFSVAYANGTEFFRVGNSFLGVQYELDIDPGGWIEQTITARILDTPGYNLSQYYRVPLPIEDYQIKGIFRHSIDQSPILSLETPSITFVIQ